MLARYIVKRPRLLTNGATRWVVLWLGYAFKVPRPTHWKSFLNGLLGNMQEVEFSQTGWKELCPVLFSLPGGFLVVMPEARPLSDTEWEDFLNDVYSLFVAGPDGEYQVPVEAKRDSFGYVNNRLVAIDYGS